MHRHGSAAGPHVDGTARPSLPSAKRFPFPQCPSVSDPRLAVIDMDGTLLTSRHEVTVATREAIDQAVAHGIEIVLASSRASSAMRRTLVELKLTEPAVFVASQGAVTGTYTDSGELRISHREPLLVADAKRIAILAADTGIPLNWFNGTRWLVSAIDDQVLREAQVVGLEPQLADLNLERTGPDKLMLMVGPGDLDKLRTIREMMPEGAAAQTSNPTYLEITRSGVDKASAVRRLCNGWGIGAQQVVAFGDGLNDLGLFEFAGTSIAPANACEIVQRQATFVSDSNDDDGVAHAITALLRYVNGPQSKSST